MLAQSRISAKSLYEIEKEWYGVVFLVFVGLKSILPSVERCFYILLHDFTSWISVLVGINISFDPDPRI